MILDYVIIYKLHDSLRFTILIQAYLTSILNRLEATDNGQNMFNETMELSGQTLNTSFTFKEIVHPNILTIFTALPSFVFAF